MEELPHNDESVGFEKWWKARQYAVAPNFYTDHDRDMAKMGWDAMKREAVEVAEAEGLNADDTTDYGRGKVRAADDIAAAIGEIK